MFSPRLVHPRSTGEELFTMVEAYIDESGIHQGASVCVVSGYYGVHDEWKQFEARWSAALRLFEVEYFHSTEFWGRKDGRRIGFYDGWDDDKANAFLERLLTCVDSSSIVPVAHGIVIKDWTALSVNTRRWLTGAIWNGSRFRTSGSPNKPYYVPFHLCLLEPLIRSGSRVVHYFFGLDRTFAGHAHDLFKEIKKLEALPGRERLGQIGFPLSKDTPGLQAADLLTYCLYLDCQATMRSGCHADTMANRLLAKDPEPERRVLLKSVDLENMLALNRVRMDAKLRSIHESIRCVACQKLRSQHQIPSHSECFEDTSHRETGTISHTVFRYGQYIESQLGTIPYWRRGGMRHPVYDPRAEGR